MTTTTTKNHFIITPEFRVSFPSLFIPTAMSEEQKKKYSVTMLFPKGTDISGFKKLVADRIQEKWGNNRPKNLELPTIGDGNSKDYNGYKDQIFIKATAIARPGVVDRNRQPILNSEDVYGGCYAVASITTFAWEHRAKNGTIVKQGISFGLRSLMKTRDGQPFGGYSNPEEEFKDVSVATDDIEGSTDDKMFDM